MLSQQKKKREREGCESLEEPKRRKVGFADILAPDQVLARIRVLCKSFMRFIFDDYPNDTPIAKQTQKQKMSSSVEEEQLQLEKKRQREGCESEEEPKRWEVDDLGYADILPPQEVIDRIQVLCKSFMRVLFNDSHPSSLKVEDMIDFLCKYFMGLLSNNCDAVFFPDEVPARIQLLYTSFMSFYSNKHICYKNVLPPHQVRGRIQNFPEILNSPDPAISNLPHMKRKLKLSKRILLALVRVWKVMSICFCLLDRKERVIQLKLFFMLCSRFPDYFSSQVQVSRTLQDVVALLRCSPSSLGINECFYGCVGGCIEIKDSNQKTWRVRYYIPFDLKLIDSLVMKKTNACCIVVVEKRGLFEKFVDYWDHDQIPSIFLSASGYPDIATRYMLHRMSQAFPHLPILALVDWSPVGLDILYTYKFLSIGKGHKAHRYACDVKWMGVRLEDVDKFPVPCFYPLKPRDHLIAKSLISSEILEGNYRDELEAMVNKGQVETEALYCNKGFYFEKYVRDKYSSFTSNNGKT